MTTPVPTDQTRRVDLPHRRRRGARFLVLYTVYLAIVVALGVKLVWWTGYGVPPTRATNPDDVWNFYYPKLRTSGVLDVELSQDNQAFDVLLLGGSVLEQVAGRLEAELRSRSDRPVRVFNLCTSAHTSRDSALKAERLKERSGWFELIVVYHGINDARMNCCPAEAFRDDYTHCRWYAGLKRRLEAGTVTLPGVLADQFARLIPLGEPDPESLDSGATIRTAGPFRRNLQIIASAGPPVVLMTFAYHIPPDYSRDKFQRHELDYGRGPFELPIELWGRPDHVAAAIDAHNRAIRQLAAEHYNVIFVDQQKLVPRDGRHFSDVCHLTDAGIEAFVENLVAPIAERFRSE